MLAAGGDGFTPKLYFGKLSPKSPSVVPSLQTARGHRSARPPGESTVVRTSESLVEARAVVVQYVSNQRQA